jgi:hypothetical protein
MAQLSEIKGIAKIGGYNIGDHDRNNGCSAPTIPHECTCLIQVKPRSDYRYYDCQICEQTYGSQLDKERQETIMTGAFALDPLKPYLF